MNLAIVGVGYVGLVSGVCFAAKGHRVVANDKNLEKIKMLRAGRIPIFEPGLEDLLKEVVSAGRLVFTEDLGEAVRSAEAVFLCVDTPPKEDGMADLSSIESASRQIAKHLSGYKVIVEKSTVPVKTGERVRRTLEKYCPPGASFDVVSNPEFLREGSAVQDALAPDRIVVGAETDKARAAMKELYAGFSCPILFTDIKSSEMIKHAANAFLAMKISFANAVAQICELAGADIGQVAKGIGLDKRIGASFLNAGIGYGGSCFPKDVDAFARISEELGYRFGLLREVQEINRFQRQHFIRKIEDELWVVKDKEVGILGVAFKPDTDDIREAPFLTVAEALLAKGAKVRAYDPKASENAKKVLPGVRYVDSAYAAAEGADCLVIVTEWDEFRKLDLARVKKSMTHPTVIDGRNLFEPSRMKEMGFVYRSIGR